MLEANVSCREHILQDIQPYMCTYPECPEADAMYANRAAWLDDEAQTHRKVWRCFEHTNFFQSKETLQRHLGTAHPTLGEAQAQAPADLGFATTVPKTKGKPVPSASLMGHSRKISPAIWLPIWRVSPVFLFQEALEPRMARHPIRAVQAMLKETDQRILWDLSTWTSRIRTALRRGEIMTPLRHYLSGMMTTLML